MFYLSKKIKVLKKWHKKYMVFIQPLWTLCKYLVFMENPTTTSSHFSQQHLLVSHDDIFSFVVYFPKSLLNQYLLLDSPSVRLEYLCKGMDQVPKVTILSWSCRPRLGIISGITVLTTCSSPINLALTTNAFISCKKTLAKINRKIRWDLSKNENKIDLILKMDTVDH